MIDIDHFGGRKRTRGSGTLRRRSRFGAAVFATTLSALLAVPVASTAAVRGVSIRGTVFSSAGSPLALASVTAYALPGLRPGCLSSPDEWAVVAKTTTSLNGTYVLPRLAPGHYRIGVVPQNVSIDSFGYRLKTVYADSTPDGANVTSWIGYADDVTAPGPPADVRLAKPASITGRITDATTDAGVPGIEIRFVTTGQWQRIYPYAVTNATGNFAMKGLPLGVPDPVAFDPNNPTAGNEAMRYGPVLVDPNGWYGVYLWWFDGLDNGQDYTVDLTDAAPDVYSHEMTRAGRVTVEVVDPSGMPVRGLAVTTDSAFPWPPQLTDGEGLAYIGIGSGGPEATDEVTLRVADYAGRYRTTWTGSSPTLSTAQHVPVVAGEDNYARIVVRPDAATVISSLKYSSRDPYRSVMPDSAPWLSAVLRGADTNDWDEYVGSGGGLYCDGNIVLKGLWPGVRVDLVAGDQYFEGTIDSGIRVWPDVNYIGTQRFPSWMFSGSVSDPGGNPVSATIELWVDQGEGWQRSDFAKAVANTDAEGRFGQLWTEDGAFLSEPWLPTEDQPILHVFGAGFDGFFQDQGDGTGILVSNPDDASAMFDDNPYDRWASSEVSVQVG